MKMPPLVVATRGEPQRLETSRTERRLTHRR
jgi:hypothetical protein